VSRDHENLIEKTVWQYENFILGNGVGGGEEREELVRLEDWTIRSWKQKETNQKTQYSTRLLGVLKK
jgi:hypothetical protein